jgi:hypothetical protein
VKILDVEIKDEQASATDSETQDSTTLELDEVIFNFTLTVMRVASVGTGVGYAVGVEDG